MTHWISWHRDVAPRMFIAWSLPTDGAEMDAVGVDTPSFRCLCLGAWYQERGKNWDVVRVGLFKLDDLWMDGVRGETLKI